uniref:Uncharacterized protein n=1 Tax=Hanusia phi TaxID=3032 RepID=A0A7S0HBF6_9CRYP
MQATGQNIGFEELATCMTEVAPAKLMRKTGTQSTQKNWLHKSKEQMELVREINMFRKALRKDQKDALMGEEVAQALEETSSNDVNGKIILRNDRTGEILCVNEQREDNQTTVTMIPASRIVDLIRQIQCMPAEPQRGRWKLEGYQDLQGYVTDDERIRLENMEQTEYMFAFNALSQGKCWRCEKEGDIIPLIESGKGSRKLSIFCRHWLEHYSLASWTYG